MIALTVFIWWLVGVSLFVWALRLIDPVITRMDAAVALVAGIFGPLNILYVFGELANRWHTGGFWNKPVWPRSPRQEEKQ